MFGYNGSTSIEHTGGLPYALVTLPVLIETQVKRYEQVEEEGYGGNRP